MSPRVANIILGAWLFISAFLWPHTSAQFNNAIIVGLLAIVFAVVAMAGYVWARYANAALAGWLFLSTLFLPRISTATLWNHILVAVAVFIFAMIPSAPGWRGTGRRTATVKT